MQLHSRQRVADYDKFDQNAFTGSPVNAAGTRMTLSAYINTTPRTNSFSQNDLAPKFVTAQLAHTLLGGFEFGYQTGLAFRQDGFFATTGTQSLVVNPPSPVSRVPADVRYNGGNDSRYDPGLAA